LSTKDLLTLENFLFTRFMNPQWQLYATLGSWTWVPQKLKNKVLKQLVNHRMIMLATKPWDMYDNKKNDELKIEWKTKILFFTLNCSSIDVWKWIFFQSMIEGNIYLWKIKIKLCLNLSNLEQIVDKNFKSK
jgi:hypothetical protein